MDGDLYYILGDHLGSTSLVVDESGAEQGHVIYDAYGQVVENTLPEGLTDRLFTGQVWDDTIGLYFYNARYYDPFVGQFTQPDSLVADPMNPAAWNRFSYVYNSPVNFTDPTGNFVCGGACIAGLVGAAVLGGVLNVGVNALTRDDYNVWSTRALGDFAIGAAFGVASYGVGNYLLTSARIAGALGLSTKSVWAGRIALTARVFALGELNALESFIMAKSYGDSFGGHDARYAFGVGIVGALVGEGIGAIGKGAADDLAEAYARDNAEHVGKQITRAGKKIQAFEESAILTKRMANSSIGTYPRGLVNRLIRQRNLLFNNLQHVARNPQSLPYPSGLQNFIKTASFLAVSTYGDAEYYPLIHQSVSP